MKQNWHKNPGFTLIELLVVISIIGLLSSIILIVTHTANASARNATRISDLDAMQKALELYFADHNSYPQATAGSSTWAATLGQSLSPYMAPLPKTIKNPQLAPLPGLQDFSYAGGTGIIVSNCAATHLQFNINGGYYLKVIMENYSTDLKSQNDGGVSPTTYELFGGNYTRVAC